MYSLTLKKRIIKKPYVTELLVDQEMIIMDAISQSYFSLNAIGAKIWSLLHDGSMTMMDLAQYLQKECNFEEQRSIQHVQQFIELLFANALVELN